MDQKVKIKANIVPKLNLSFYQNSVPIICELKIKNQSEQILDNVELKLSSTPSFFTEKTWRIESIKKDQDFFLSDLDISLNNKLLSRLTEAETATVSFELFSSNETFSFLELPIELLARNEWGGIRHMPELIAAFVQPNEPTIDRVLKKAASVLRQNGKAPELNGYQDGAKRAWELSSAIWTAVGTMKLDYSSPPASFENEGQKIRSSVQISDTRIATCMDTTVLFCSLLEQCNLNPIIVFVEEHVFVGVWLKPKEFSTVVVDDVTALRKRIQLNELILFETTLVTQRPCPSFKVAIDRGKKQISEDEETNFELAIDIRRARLQKIKPLASNTSVKYEDKKIESSEDTIPSFEEAPEIPDDEVFFPDKAESTVSISRLERWQRKLLDLSLRNNLLNFRTTKRSIKFDAPEPGRLEDILADGHTLKLLPRPELMRGKDQRDRAIYEARTNDDIINSHAKEGLNKKIIYANLSKKDLEGRLVTLYRFARASLQEGGANTLFLALGFLSWTRDSKDKKHYQAPLILLPITLLRKSVRSGFRFRLLDDEPKFNPTLIEMLRQDFNLELPFSQEELPKDKHGLDIRGIWNQVSQAIVDIRGWEVVEDIVLATFSFAKYLMWKDLVDRTGQLKQNNVVKHLIDSHKDPFISQIEFPDPAKLDIDYPPERIFCPLPVDSSQLSATIAAANGKDFVLIGPPGTGKSQTIANIIAQCLAEQKTVLFVSEKIAALNVVHRRLSEVGLGDFCIELHSNKARKLELLEKLRTSWDAKGNVNASEWKENAIRLKEIRDHLNLFVKHLHLRRRNGMSVFNAIGLVVAGQDIVKLNLAWPSADEHNNDDLYQIKKIVDEIAINAKVIGSIADHPLRIISKGDWSPNWQQSVIKAAQDGISSVEDLLNKTKIIAENINISDETINLSVLAGISYLSAALPKAAGKDWRFALRPDAGQIVKDLNESLKTINEFKQSEKQLSDPWEPSLIDSVKKGLSFIDEYREVINDLSEYYEIKGLQEIDIEKINSELENSKSSWVIGKWFGYRKIRSIFQGHQKENVTRKLTEENLCGDIEKLAKLHSVKSEIESLNNLKNETDGIWNGIGTPKDDILSGIKFQILLKNRFQEENYDKHLNIKETYKAVFDGRCGKKMQLDLSLLQSMQNARTKLEKFDHLKDKTNGLWLGLNSQTDQLDNAISFHKSISKALSMIATTPESVSQLKNSLDHLFGEANVLLEPAGLVSNSAQEFRLSLNEFSIALKTVSKITGNSNSDLISLIENDPRKFSEFCQEIIKWEQKINSWCAWRRARNAALKKGLLPLIESIENKTIETDQVVEAFETNYARWWINTIVENDEVLKAFVSATHEKHIEDFRTLDKNFTELTRSYVRSSLCSNLPDHDEAMKNKEWGILRREMQKKRRHMPLREIMNQIPNVVTKLAPCMMMSPLSIAQYLSADTALFDIVVFDEASQISVWDAVGAMARAKQIVMVGDPKQLPPTSFFNRTEADGDYDPDIESDLESILDECLGASLPTMNLLWHYRSRHESLISFSNNRYYSGGLVTFPSPSTKDRAVNFHFQSSGIYEKGGARINKPEAHSLVKHIVQRLKDKAFQKSNLTIGVVTFNSEQQNLIENLLDDERRKDPAIESFFSEDKIEPIFVKNLESVQGDERDIMYFSTTYGPDISGSVSMNFGPMNRDGGERRLNVAITRSRQELHVFSSLKPEQIDLSRTRAAGVRDLKHFMEYAEHGAKALAASNYGSLGDYESPFEQAVADALIKKGWQVHSQVGVSSFRIDLGIVNPDAPGKYLVGVECDGATYHRSATARDRDKIREQVLVNLGWDIIRIWSTDWWIDAEGSLEVVDRKISKLLETQRELDKKQIESIEENNDIDENQITESQNLFDNEIEKPNSTIEEKTENVDEVIENEDAFNVKYAKANFDSNQPNTISDIESILIPYSTYSSETLVDPRKIKKDEVASKLLEIIAVEGPMLAKRAYDTYLRGCGIKRMGKELKKLMNSSLQILVKQGAVNIQDEMKTGGYIYTFVRAKDTPPIRLRERGNRTFHEIPPSEVLTVAALVKANSREVIVDQEQFFRDVLKKFELKRLTASTKERLSEIFEMEFDYVNNWLIANEGTQE